MLSAVTKFLAINVTVINCFKPFLLVNVFISAQQIRTVYDCLCDRTCALLSIYIYVHVYVRILLLLAFALTFRRKMAVLRFELPLES